MNVQLPARLSEGYFRLFEPVIARAVAAYPESIQIGPVGEWSLTTTTARLRDAALSYRRFRWSSAQIDPAEFDKLWPRMQIRQVDTDEKCVIGPRLRNKGRPPKSNNPEFEPVTVRADTEDGVLSEEEVLAFMTLLAGQRVRGPVLIVGHDIDGLRDFVGDRDLTVFEQEGKIYIL